LEIDRDQVRRIARLARLDVTGEEETRWVEELSRVLAWVAKIAEIEGEGPEARPGVLPCPLREDVAAPNPGARDLLEQAPDTRDGLVRVDAVFPTRDRSGD
jgi:aspartyl-tRNA(Asn)/glutamyl-tRNA(Gln) amidotransferase subunit C